MRSWIFFSLLFFAMLSQIESASASEYVCDFGRTDIFKHVDVCSNCTAMRTANGALALNVTGSTVQPHMLVTNNGTYVQSAQFGIKTRLITSQNIFFELAWNDANSTSPSGYFSIDRSSGAFQGYTTAVLNGTVQDGRSYTQTVLSRLTGSCRSTNEMEGWVCNHSSGEVNMAFGVQPTSRVGIGAEFRGWWTITPSHCMFLANVGGSTGFQPWWIAITADGHKAHWGDGFVTCVPNQAFDTVSDYAPEKDRNFQCNNGYYLRGFNTIPFYSEPIGVFNMVN